MILLYIAAGVLGLWLIAAVAGVGSNTVFRNPKSMSDAQLERTMRLTGKIMDNSKVFSNPYNAASKKFSAAAAEMERRYGSSLTPGEQQNPSQAD